MDFKDYFSQQSQDYQDFRPDYPIELYQYLLKLAPGTSLAWDCATGTGQAAIALADNFDQVIATDASEQQIEVAIQHHKVNYFVAAETCHTLADNTVDLVTVAQALHWFNTEVFFKETLRVLKPGGLFCAWTYNLLTVSEAIDTVINNLYYNMLGNYWPPERRMVENGYSKIKLPYECLNFPTFNIEKQWTLNNLYGYLNTWSATKRYETHLGVNPVHVILNELAMAWGGPETTYTVSWPITMIGFKKPA